MVHFTTTKPVRLAYPSKGRLADGSKELLGRLGVPVDDSRRLFYQSSRFECFALRSKDIPQQVEQGTVDYGITGLDLVLEAQADVVQCSALPFGFCRLVLAAPDGFQIEDLEGGTIATSFVNLALQFLQGEGVSAKVIPFSGSVEASISLGAADAIVDLMSSGETLRKNGLTVVKELLASSAVLISSKNAPAPRWLYA